MEPTAVATRTGASGITNRWPSLLLIKLGRITLHRITTELAPLGLKPAQFATLVELNDRGPVTQQSLAEVLHLDPTNVVALLNELEERGLAERRRDPEDRRRHNVEISARGRTLLAKAEKAMNAAEAELLEGLDPGQKRELEELLAQLWRLSGGYEAYAEAATETLTP